MYSKIELQRKSNISLSQILSNEDKRNKDKRSLDRFRKSMQTCMQDDQDIQISSSLQIKNIQPYKKLQKMQHLKCLCYTIMLCDQETKQNLKNHLQIFRDSNLRSPLIHYLNSKQVNQFIKKKLKGLNNQFIILFSSQEIFYQTLKFVSYKQYCSFVYFNNSQSQKQIRNTCKIQKINRQKQWSLVQYATNHFPDFVNKYYNQKITVPNFLYVQEQKTKTNFIKMIYYNAILSQNKLEPNNLYKIEQFIKQKWITTQTQIQEANEFFQKYRQGKLEPLTKYYTLQNFFYKYFNTACKVFNNPLQFFYIAQFIKKFNQEIKQGYAKSQTCKKNNDNQPDIYFRGGLMNEVQIQKMKENKGKYINNLGMVSTSQDISKAKIFSTNVLYKIIVYHAERDPEFDFGYFRPKSHNPGQKEVLFNFLSLFRIKDVTYDLNQKLHIIELVYGQLAEVSCLQQNKNKIPQRLKQNYQYLLNLLKQQRNLMRKCSYYNILINNGLYKTAVSFCKAKINYMMQNAINKNNYQQQILNCHKQILNAYLLLQYPQKVIQYIEEYGLRSEDDPLIQKYLGQSYQKKLVNNSFLQLKNREQFKKAQECLQKALNLLGYKPQQRSIQKIQQSIIRNRGASQEISSCSFCQDLQKISVIMDILNSLSNIQQKVDLKLSIKYSLESLLLGYKFLHQGSQILMAQLFKHVCRFGNQTNLETIEQLNRLESNIRNKQDKNVPILIFCLIYKCMLYLQVEYNRGYPKQLYQQKNKGKAQQILRQVQQLKKSVSKPFSDSEMALCYCLISSIYSGLQKSEQQLYNLKKAEELYNKLPNNKLKLLYIKSRKGELLKTVNPQLAKSQFQKSIEIIKNLILENNQLSFENERINIIQNIIVCLNYIQGSKIEEKTRWAEQLKQELLRSKDESKKQQLKKCYLYLIGLKMQSRQWQDINLIINQCQYEKITSNEIRIIKLTMQRKASKAYELVNYLNIQDTVIGKFVKNFYIAQLKTQLQSLKQIRKSKNRQQLETTRIINNIDLKQLREVLGDSISYIKFILEIFYAYQQLGRKQQAIATYTLLLDMPDQKLITLTDGQFNHQKINDYIQRKLLGESSYQIVNQYIHQQHQFNEFQSNSFMTFSESIGFQNSNQKKQTLYQSKIPQHQSMIEQDSIYQQYQSQNHKQSNQYEYQNHSGRFVQDESIGEENQIFKQLGRREIIQAQMKRK